MTWFEIPASWSRAQTRAVAQFSERLLEDIHRHLPLDAYLCTACVRAQLHLPTDENASYVDEYRREHPEDLPPCSWSPAQLGAVMAVVSALDRSMWALLAALEHTDETPSQSAAQLVLELERPPTAVLAWSEIPF